MSLSEEAALRDVPEVKTASMESAEAAGPQSLPALPALSEPGGPGGLGGQRSAPSSPCVSRKPPQTLGIGRPGPGASPTPLRRGGSLRLRGEKPAKPGGFGQTRIPGVRNGGPGPMRISPGAAFPSITEAAESWRKSLRGSGDELWATSPTGPTGPTGTGLGHSTLRQQRHHRSLQSLNSRCNSRDSYPHTPTPSPEDLDLLHSQNLNRFLLDHAKAFSGDHDDLDSLRSYGSNCSTQSACDHAQFARNGTTFSGRRMKFIVHCSSHPEPNEYLTPTQRANQQIRRLKALVEQARKDLEAKDENIFKLTKEVVELRLLREEVDGSPAKTTINLGDSPVCKVVSQLENECGNSTSLSDSGHFDDVLSLTSAQSAHSPGPRQHTLSPESERMAELYQRKIDDVTRKQGEKSVEDRKSLVDMYEKKMEDMSRKSSEKFQQEKNNLIEMYERKIGDIVRRHQEKLQDEKSTIQESYEKKIEALSQKLGNQNALSLSNEQSVQVLTKKLEETQSMLQMAEKRVASLTLQTDELNLRFSELQQELFQSREKTVLLEEEVEALQRSLTAQEFQLSEKQNSLVQMAQLESEVHVLQNRLEEQKSVLQQKSQVETELARVLSKLNEEEQKFKILEGMKLKAEELHEEKQNKTSQHQLKLEIELSSVLDALKEEKKKNVELENEKRAQQKEMKLLAQKKLQLEAELVQMLSCLKDKEQECSELKECEAEAKALYKKEQESALQLRSRFDELDRAQELLTEEKQKNAMLEHQNTRVIALENECRRTQESVLQLKAELAAVNLNCTEEEKKNNDLKLESKHLQEQIVKYRQQIGTLSEHSKKMEFEMGGLRNSVERKDSIIFELREKLDKSHDESEKQSQQVQNLSQGLLDAEIYAAALSSSLSEEKIKNEELIHWKLKASELQKNIQLLEEDLTARSQQLQYLQGIENEVMLLKHDLKVENGRVEELLPWKSKARNLEEELKSLKGEIAEQIENMHLVNELSESINRDVNSLRLPLKRSSQDNEQAEEKLSPQVTLYEAQQHILQLESEIVNLKESLDQSYWALSEKETARLDMEKSILEQGEEVEKLKNEISGLNQCISKLKTRNNDLLVSKQQDINIEDNMCAGSQKNDICLKNASESRLCDNFTEESIVGAADIVSQLRAEVQSLRKALADQEDRHTEMNLKMYLKGQEAAKFERKDQVFEMAAHASEKVSVPELLTQLSETEKELEKVKDNQLENMPKSSLSLLSASEAVFLYLLGSFKAMYRQLAEGQASSSSSPEATLLFLKSAFYYFLTDEANCQGHLHAIQSILGFTESEKHTIDTLTYFRR